MAVVCVLVGPPGAGKSTVGRLVAERLGVTFRDTDDDVANSLGKPVAEIFYDDGEATFRAAERAAVLAALQEHDGVLALGGGAVLDPATRADLQGQPVVALTVSAGEAAKRVGFNRDRPLLLGTPRATLSTMLEERRPFYDEVARCHVATDDRSVDDVVSDVVNALATIGASR